MNDREPGWVTIAVLGRTRGNRGEITAFPLSRPERFEGLTQVNLFGSGEQYEVERTWFHQDVLIFKFRGIDSISDAEKLVASEVRLPIGSRVTLEPGEYFHDDLIGCQVIDRWSGEALGRVAEWQDAGGSGMLVLEGGLMIPLVRAICVEISPAAKRIAVELPEGLKDLNRS